MMNNDDLSICAGEYGVAENSILQLRQFFVPLIKSGLCLKSVTTDGNPHVIRIFKELFPDIITQRCVVHVQRQGLMWCRIKPKRTDAKHLRKLFLMVTSIKTIKQKNSFIRDFNNWEKRYGEKIATTAEHGWVFSDLKRARSMLIKAMPNMFHYLDDNSIPSTTNSLEGYFSRLKPDYRKHRGLSPGKRKQYFKWYFLSKNR